MSVWLLDRVGDAPVPAGYETVDNEVSFLRMATAGSPLVVKGDQLCRWALVFCEARGLVCRELLSPSRALRQLMPSLTETQAQQICKELSEDLLAEIGDLSISDLLQKIYPNSLWHSRPSRTHAAEWLLWLYEQPAENVYEPLLVEQSNYWQSEANSVDPRIYAATNTPAAQELLDIWLGVQREPLLRELGEFPLAIPKKLRDHVAKAWRAEIISRRGDLIADLQQLPIVYSLLRTAAEETVRYLERHPGDLTRVEYEQLAPYLGVSDQERILRLIPPEMPPEPPIEPEAILTWFRERYLPARQWQVQYGFDEDRSSITKAARDFATWYLEGYPRALVGDKLTAYLSFQRTASLAQRDDDYITLLVVLDGLHTVDAAQLLNDLLSRTARLMLWSDVSAFAPLPTITEFCKPSLFAGAAPELADRVGTVGIVLPENSSPIDDLSRALPGDLFLWRIVEPDRTYHNRNNSKTLRHDVNAQLRGVADKVVEIVNEVPAERRLRVILTSDHGRLLARSERNLDVPLDMESHGRAAWGRAGREFGRSGYIVDDRIVFLHSGRFGLPYDAAIALDEESFRMNDGKTGGEWFPHGGLYPEEVIVPWIELLRDATRPNLGFGLRGSGQAGRPGELTLWIRNSELIAISVREITLTMNRRQETIPLELTVAAMDEVEHFVALTAWPTIAETENMQAKLHIRLPNRQAFTAITRVTEVQSSEMYHRDDILGDLDL